MPNADVSLPYAWYDVPADIKRLLTLAVEHWHDEARSRAYVDEAVALAGDNVDVLTSAYRYFFYKADVSAALAIADRVIAHVAATRAWPDDWEQGGWPQLADRLAALPDDTSTRLFLSAYSGKGLLLARLGKLDEAQLIAGRVAALDPRRQFGATTLGEVLRENVSA